MKGAATMNATKFVFFALGMFFIPRVYAFDTATIQMTEQYGVAITAGGYHICALFEDDVIKCWGPEGALENVPSLSGVKQVSAGGYHNCAIAENGVKCWGANGKHQTDVPILSNPKQISSGVEHTCALDDHGVTCWGSNESNQLSVPQLSNPKQISAGSHHTCALGDNGVTCWGLNFFNQINVPALSNPKLISAGYDHTCALNDNEVKCWGKLSPTRILNSLSDFKQISSGGERVCALDDIGVRCWADMRLGQTNVPRLYYPKLVSSGVFFSCAVDAYGLNCWGAGAPAVSNWNAIQGSIESFEKSLKRFSDHSYKYRSLYYLALADTLAKLPGPGTLQPYEEYRSALVRTFTLYLSEPMVMSTDTPYFETKIYPFFQRLKKQVSERYNIHSILDVDLSRSTVELSIVAAIRSVQLSREFVTSEEHQTQIQNLLADLGQLQARFTQDSTNYKTIARDLDQILGQNEKLITYFIQIPRARAFGEVLSLIREYL